MKNGNSEHNNAENLGNLWSVWELMGDSAGMSRGRMRDTLVAAKRPGWDLVDAVASVGSTGWWPHTMGLWRLEDDADLAKALNSGEDDGVDETSFRWGRSRLYQQIAGKFSADSGAFLVEYVRAKDPEALAGMTGPDLVLQELLAPWQGFVMWGAKDLADLGRREREGIGSGSLPGMVEVTGWWVVATPDRELV